ncbi:MAG TPA: helix-turn-helix transcriptional regulator [Thermoanaerobaculia bacterium]|nr:helix-turn-helix transcriptional regulator [Thermoanaerobaculia bacterium]
MTRRIPPPPGAVLTFLRTVRGWKQQELAEAAGSKQNIVSDFESGRRPLKRWKLESLAALMGVEPEAIDLALLCVDLLRPAAPPAASAVTPTEAQRRGIDRAAVAAARAAAEATRAALTRLHAAARARQQRRAAEEVWRRCAGNPDRLGTFLSDERHREQRTWALCAKLCDESVRAAVASADRAQALAGLALRIAGTVVGDRAWQSRVQGYAWAFVGNALRVAGHLRRADRAFARAWALWRAGAGSAGVELVQEIRLLELESSLRREQRRHGEALALLDRALVQVEGDARARLLLKKGFTLERMDAYEPALAALAEAAPLIDQKREPRLWCVLRFNVAVNLCHLGRYAAARPALAEARELAIALRAELDLVRVLWLEGRIAAGLGRQEEALRLFSQVRAQFAVRAMAYDFALASLDLATLYLERGETAEVQELARQMAPVFAREGLGREAVAALRPFYEAALGETATVELAQQAARELARARPAHELTEVAA